VKKSVYKNADGQVWIKNWQDRVLAENGLDYQRLTVETSFGKTSVLAKNRDRQDLPAFVFLPGFRTCAIFADIWGGLKPLYEKYRIFLVDVIGQPGLSAAETPPVKSNEYGVWVKEVLQHLGLEKVTIAGASFGGLLILKLAQIAPEMIEKAIFINPGGVVDVSMPPRNIYYSLLPMLFKNRSSMEKFLRKIVFCNVAKIDPKIYEQMMEYMVFAIKDFKNGADFPYMMSDNDLANLKAPAYFLLDEDDKLIPQLKTLARAKEKLPNLADYRMLKGYGHGLEIFPEAWQNLAEMLDK
jgi:pimeloyl-ACP methyl ester carboxylesterase